MKNSTYMLIFLLIGCKNETMNPELIEQFTINSLYTRHTYDITVQLPEDYNYTSKNYATMYVLDAKQDDASVGGICNKESKEIDTPNVIVVGLRYRETDFRDTDYTPTKTAYGKGGSEGFMNFMKKELIPKIQMGYKADTLRTNRIIIGHSFGGLFGAYAFTKHNEVFGNYLLLSPSLFYDNSVILKYEQQERGNNLKSAQLVYIGLGGVENGLLPANDLFFQRLRSYYPSAVSAFELIPGLGHMSSKSRTVEKAIEFYFKNRKHV